MPISDLDLIEQLAYAVQLGLGIIFLAAMIPKLHYPAAFKQSVAEYQLLPEGLTGLVATSVIVTESFITGAFLTGWMVGIALPLAAVLLAAFSAAIAINLHRGRRIRCGCFGGENEHISTRSLARLGMLLSAVMLLALMSTPRPSADSVAQDGLSALPYLVQVGSVSLFLILAGSWLLSPSEVTFSLRHLRHQHPPESQIERGEPR